jgi:hypothetical protein
MRNFCGIFTRISEPIGKLSLRRCGLGARYGATIKLFFKRRNDSKVTHSLNSNGLAISEGKENTRNGKVLTAALAAIPPINEARNPLLFMFTSITR